MNKYIIIKALLFLIVFLLFYFIHFTINKKSTSNHKVDCVASDWGNCDSKNGTQTRSIIIPPLNQGKACPELIRNCPWTPRVRQGNPEIIDSSKIIFNYDGDHIVSEESYNIFENSVFIQFNIPEITTSGFFGFTDTLFLHMRIYSDIIIFYIDGSEQKTNYTPGDIFQTNYNGTTAILNLIDSNSVIYWTSSFDYTIYSQTWSNFNTILDMYNNTQTAVTLSGIMFYKKVATQPINLDCEFEWGVCDTTTGTQTRSIITLPLNQGKACPELIRNCPWTPRVRQGNPEIIDSSKIIFNKDDYVVSEESYNIFENSVFIQFNIPEITTSNYVFVIDSFFLDIRIYSDIIIFYTIGGSPQKTNYTPGDIFQTNYNGTTVIFNLIDSNSVIYWTSSVDYSLSVYDWTNFNSRLEIYNDTQTTVTVSGIMFYKKVATQPINLDCEFISYVCDTTGTQAVRIIKPPLNQGKACPEPRECN